MVTLARFSGGYAPEPTLKNLSLTIPRGQTTVLLGPGGSGKSSLLKRIAGGTSVFAWQRGRFETAATRIELLPQCPTQVATPELAIFEGLWPEEALAFWAEKPESLASRWLAALSLAMRRDPDLLLIDEPMANLEPEAQAWIEAFLSQLRGRLTMLLVTHHLASARRIGDFAVLLIEGRIVEVGSVPEFFEAPRLARTQRFVLMGS